MRRRKPGGQDSRLVDLVPEVRAEYAAFLRGARDEAEDSKAFAARHAAANTALTHLEHLIQVAGGSDGESGGADPTEGLLSDTRNKMNQEKQEMPEDDAAGESG